MFCKYRFRKEDHAEDIENHADRDGFTGNQGNGGHIQVKHQSVDHGGHEREKIRNFEPSQDGDQQEKQDCLGSWPAGWARSLTCGVWVDTAGSVVTSACRLDWMGAVHWH